MPFYDCDDEDNNNATFFDLDSDSELEDHFADAPNWTGDVVIQDWSPTEEERIAEAKRELIRQQIRMQFDLLVETYGGDVVEAADDVTMALDDFCRERDVELYQYDECSPPMT